tara:strand:- start:8764 stop:8937 length:174 start_codon:yes stop_codon:yes gene_type:complete
MNDLIRRLEDWEKSVEKEEREEKRDRVWYLIERTGIIAMLVAVVFLIHAVIKIASLE